MGTLIPFFFSPHIQGICKIYDVALVLAEKFVDPGLDKYNYALITKRKFWAILIY